MKKLLTASLLTLVLFTACKKDPQPAAPSLKGKWTIENMLYKEYVGGSLDNTYTEPGAGGTIDFQNNGNVVSTIAGNPVQTSPYTIKPDSKVEIDGDIYEIRNLTSTSVTLFIREDYAPGEYDESYINLKR
jgi:hypothetical protein